jgi:uncharacterized membrane protein YdbT with pleckstrin-like domain
MIGAVDLHPGEEIVFEGHPSWRGLLSFYVSAVAGAVVIGVVVGLVGGAGLGIAVAAVLVVVALVVGFARRMATTYLVTTQRLHIRRGILAKRAQQARIDRVQNVNTEQSLVDRIVRVGTVDFDTAGTDDSEFKFVGIASPDHVVAVVDKAQREAAERAATPRFVHEPPTASAG